VRGDRTAVLPAARDRRRPHQRGRGGPELRPGGGHAGGHRRRARTARHRIRRWRGVRTLTRPTVMRAVVSWSLTYRFLVVAAAVALMAFGAATVRSSA